MKNFVQPGDTVTLTAPYAVSSGDDITAYHDFRNATTLKLE